MKKKMDFFRFEHYLLDKQTVQVHILHANHVLSTATDMHNCTYHILGPDCDSVKYWRAADQSGGVTETAGS